VSSRQEEKEQRRAQRLAAEEEARKGAERARRFQMVGGAILAIAVVVVAVILISGGGSSDSSHMNASGDTKGDLASVPIPPAGPNANAAGLAAAAKAAGCSVKSFGQEGRTHTTGKVKYLTNPPTSGNHNPVPAEDGVYDPGNTPAKENFVHTLEHGRIEIQYKPGTPKRTRDQLETLFNEKFKGTAGYHQLLFENNTNMPFAVAATSWTHLIGCPEMNDKVFDAIRAFRDKYVDTAPEKIP
jgi:hypothetical protein